MKPIILLAFILISCRKENVITQRWQIQRWQDTAIINHAFFCSKAGNKGLDTIPVIYNDGLPDSTYPLEDRPPKITSAVPYENLYVREYFIYVKQIQ